MKFYSTNKSSAPLSFKKAVLKGQAPDGGLYFPESIPVLPKDFYTGLPDLTLPQIAAGVLASFVEDDIAGTTLISTVEDVFDFNIPLVKLDTDIYSLELFHGPTCAFKDVGARFMSRCLSIFTPSDKKTTVLVATSGDTGSAVANGFLDAANVEVVILYPAGKVSPLQEKQFASLGKNITAIAINGTFDDCQALVKKAFADQQLNKDLVLSSANSINVARWLPQSVYYFHAIGQLMKKGNKKAPVFAVPSGNYGNLAAGLLAKKMGLPVKYFIAATNMNNIVPEYLETGSFHPRPSIATIANAMDVGNPSNFVRIIELYGNDFPAINRDIKGFHCSDEEIKETIASVFSNNDYVLDPHGAIGYNALQKIKEVDEAGIFLETASPAKFPESVEPVIGEKIPLPVSLQQFVEREVNSIPMKNDYNELKALLSDKS